MKKKAKYSKYDIASMLKEVEDALEDIEKTKKDENNPNVLLKELLKPKDNE